MIIIDNVVTDHTFTDGCVVLCVSGLTDTLEGTNCVVARGVFITWILVALVDVIVTVSTMKAVRTFGTSECLVAHSVNVTTVAVTKTILAPRPAGTGCKKRGHTGVLSTATGKS